MKRVLNAVLKTTMLTDEELTTIMCEVENIANSRPLTPNSDDLKYLEAITPNHLLKLETTHVVPVAGLTEKDQLRRRWIKVQVVAEMFWSRWTKKYLSHLQLRHKKIEKKRNLKPGDLVLIAESFVPRGQWPKGRVVKVFPGKDGLVRTVELRTMTGSYIRSVTKLVYLECSLNES